jgi:hypothetical protein
LFSILRDTLSHLNANNRFVLTFKKEATRFCLQDGRDFPFSIFLIRKWQQDIQVTQSNGFCLTIGATGLRIGVKDRVRVIVRVRDRVRIGVGVRVRIKLQARVL